MQTLDIECPSCSEILELDIGFAGGVCRCSNCGTLMTVPSDAGKAESLIQPASSASIGSGGMSSMGVPDSGTRRSKPTSRAHASRRKSGKKRRTSTTIEAGEYCTASGKVIKLEKTTRVPMAEGKRKKVRAVTGIIFFSMVATVVVATVIGVIMLAGGREDSAGERGGATFDPSKNPYTLDFANAMGLPVSDRTVVVVEASEFSAAWVEAASDMLSVGLTRPTKGAEVALVGAGDKPILFAGGPPRPLPISSDEVRTWFDELPAVGGGDVAAAIAKAMAWEPQTLIVVHGDTDMSSLEAWDALVKDKPGMIVHTVHIGTNSPELEGWAGQRGGEAAVWSVEDIETLKGFAAQASVKKE